MATIKIDGLKKRYANGFEAIHGIDLDVADGELVVIVGPSGCGKSTLLRMVAGLETITEGTLSIDGTVVNDHEPGQRDIAMVFQNYALYPHMSVFNNMAYGLRNRGVGREEIKRKVADVAAILELGDLLDRKPAQLSGGQRQRVAMGRAIVRDPKVFLFDEPLSNLDAKLRVQMRIEIKRLQRRLGTTSLYVTHDQVEAMTLADRLVVMNAGRPEQIGTPMDIYTNPASMFVAGFIGSPAMNFLTLERMEGGRLRLPGSEAMLAEDDGSNGAPVLGIRPEHMRTVGTAADADIVLSVDAIEPLGADTLVYGRAPGQEGEIVLRLGGSHSIGEGDNLPVAFDRNHLHFFDRANGRRADVRT